MTFQEIRQRAGQVRRIPLETVLLAAGAQRDRHDQAKWHTPRGVLSVTGTKFMNWNQGMGGGGAIDLAMHLEELGFKAAVQWLWNLVPGSLPDGLPPVQRKPALRLPAKHVRNLVRVRHYLQVQRGLPTSLIEPLIESGRLYADRYANAVFVLLGKGKTPVGAELRGTGQRVWRAMAPGSRKDAGYFSVRPGRTHKIILCESAIDALSCFVINPDAWCISTSGVRCNPLWISELIGTGPKVYCGFDVDAAGENAAQALIARHPTVTRCRPSLHDWNAVLTSQEAL